MKKKFLLLVFTLLSTLTASAYDAEIDGIYYNFNTYTKQASVTYLSSSSSSNQDAYKGIVVIPETVEYNSEIYNVTKIDYRAFAYCSALTSVTIPNSVTSIGPNAFSSCTGLTSIIIPNSVTTIASDAFKNCTGLTSVTIGNSVEIINSYTFQGCSNLTSITIPNSVTSIGQDAFLNCSKLMSVEIGDGMISIEKRAFGWCSSLTSVTIPQSITSIGDEAFYMSSLNSIIIPDNVKSIGRDAFYYCKKLTSAIIGNGVTSIRESTFMGCEGLTSVTIGNSVTSIGNNAFSSCDGLTSVTCEATEVPSTGWDVFSNVPQSSATLYVPASALEDYKATSPWSGFGSIVAIGEEPVVEGIAINETNFPDENFRNWILSQEYGQDGVLTDEEIAEVTYIGVSYQNISNLKGIEYFTALKNLYVSSGILTSLDVSKNTALEYLDCSCNMITLLDLSQNKALKNLSCWGNALTSLDVSECTALQSIDCKYNLLTSLDVSGCTALRKLDCEHNQLTSLDVSNKTELFWLMCYNNQLTSLDVSGCPNFLTLSFYCNQIKGAAMDKLVEDLPAVDFENWMGVIYSENEGNVMTTTQVAAARAKNWIPRYAINENEGRDYEGSEPEVKKCATPTISFVGGKIVFDCETEGVEFVSEVTCSDSGKYNSSEIPVTSTYTVSVYAKKDGYEDSDVATKEITVGGGSTAKKGDVNEDGTVNGTDIQEVINIIVQAD